MSIQTAEHIRYLNVLAWNHLSNMTMLQLGLIVIIGIAVTISVIELSKNSNQNIAIICGFILIAPILFWFSGSMKGYAPLQANIAKANHIERYAHVHHRAPQQARLPHLPRNDN